MASPSIQDWEEAITRTGALGLFGVGEVIMGPLDACAVTLLTLRRPASLVVRLTLENGEGPVDLLNEHQASKPVRQRHP
jgi:hypothetical protein